MISIKEESYLYAERIFIMVENGSRYDEAEDEALAQLRKKMSEEKLPPKQRSSTETWVRANFLKTLRESDEVLKEYYSQRRA